MVKLQPIPVLFLPQNGCRTRPYGDCHYYIDGTSGIPLRSPEIQLPSVFPVRLRIAKLLTLGNEIPTTKASHLMKPILIRPLLLVATILAAFGFRANAASYASSITNTGTAITFILNEAAT